MANKKVLKLTDAEIKSAKPKEKKYTLSDGNGLQLAIFPDGRKVWEIRYTINGKPKATTGGTYPKTPLATNTKTNENGEKITIIGARQKRDELKAKVSDGGNPIAEKRAAKEAKKEDKRAKELEDASRFKNVVDRWLEDREKKTAYLTVKKDRKWLEQYASHLFDTPINKIRYADLFSIIDEVKGQSFSTETKLRSAFKLIWLYALQRKYCEVNITRDLILSAEGEGYTVTSQPTITDHKELKKLLLEIDNHTNPIIRAALQFLTIIPLRVGNLVSLKWEYIQGDILTIPRSEMKHKKKKRDFILPLPKQALAVLDEIRPFTEWTGWVFSLTGDHISANSPCKALRDKGYSGTQTAHGFRSTFSSLAATHNKQHGGSFAAKESILDHAIGNKVSQAYDYDADYLNEQRDILNWWGDYLDGVKK